MYMRIDKKKKGKNYSFGENIYDSGGEEVGLRMGGG